MNEIIFKIIAGIISTFGFAIIFRLKRRHWLLATFSGVVSCTSYFVFSELFDGDFIPNALAAFFTALLCEYFARLAKTPVTVFLLPGCIALVPGGMLYYTMNNLLNHNNSVAAECFLTTLTIGVAIGGGIIAASLVRISILRFIAKIKKA